MGTTRAGSGSAISPTDARVADGSRRDGCPMERQNLLLDRCRRRIERRLTVFAAEGITVRRRTAPEDMAVEDASLEIVEYGDTGRLGSAFRETPPHISFYGPSRGPRRLSTSERGSVPGLSPRPAAGAD
jgi:hypothetical protein